MVYPYTIEWSRASAGVGCHRTALAAIVICALATSGCGTVIANCMLEESGSPAVYRGTTLDFLAATGELGCCGAEPTVVERALLTLDLPLSIVGDTLVLPWNLIQCARSEEPEPQPPSATEADPRHEGW